MQIKGPVVIYGKRTHKLLSAYAILHFGALTPIYDQLLKLRWSMMGNVVVFDVVFILLSLTCIGMLFDVK